MNLVGRSKRELTFGMFCLSRLDLITEREMFQTSHVQGYVLLISHLTSFRKLQRCRLLTFHMNLVLEAKRANFRHVVFVAYGPHNRKRNVLTFSCGRIFASRLNPACTSHNLRPSAQRVNPYSPQSHSKISVPT